MATSFEVRLPWVKNERLVEGDGILKFKLTPMDFALAIVPVSRIIILNQ